MSERDPDSPVAAEGPGRLLRERRESLGWTREQAAWELRVSRAMLSALEDDDHAALEAPIFVRGHLRNYARLLGLPVDEMLAAYERSTRAPGDPALVPSSTRPPMDAGMPRWLISTGWVVVGIALVFGALWWYAGPHREPVAPLVMEREGEADVVERTGREPRLAEARPLDEDVEAAPADDELPAPDVLLPELTPLLLPEAAARESEPAPVLTEAEPVNGLSMVIRLSEESWIEIYDAQGDRVYYGLAAEGERLELEGEAPLRVFLGNAPGVEMEAGGRSFPVLDYLRRDNTARFQVTEPRR
jgi:cytoskeleton protein RodZ